MKRVHVDQDMGVIQRYLFEYWRAFLGVFVTLFAGAVYSFASGFPTLPGKVRDLSGKVDTVTVRVAALDTTVDELKNSLRRTNERMDPVLIDLCIRTRDPEERAKRRLHCDEYGIPPEDSRGGR